MNLKLESLRILLTVAETGSFSAAARKLGKAQSVISTTISNLEIDLALTLFERSGRYPQLTLAGVRMVKEAEILLAQSQRLQAVAGELASGIEPQLTLAIDDDSHLPWLGSLLEAFSTRFPMVELELLFPLMEDVTDLLLTGRAQLGICYKNEHPQREIVACSLGEVAMPIVVSTEHPLARKQPLEEIDLQCSRQLLVTGRGGGNERQRFRLSAQVWWVEGDLGVMELVKRGLGWAAIPAFLIQQPLARQEVVVLKSDLINSHALTLELQWHRSRPLGQAARWLKEKLQTRIPF